MDGYLFIISVHTSGCQLRTHPARCCLICIGRLRRRKRNELGLRVGDGGCWWIELSPHRGTFVNVWLVLNGLLLDDRVWGPNLDTALLCWGSPLRVSRDRTVAAQCWQRRKILVYVEMSKCLMLLFLIIFKTSVLRITWISERKHG